MHERLHYTLLQRILHWGIAVLVIFMVASGIMIGTFDNKPAVDAAWGPGGFDRLYDLHKNIGLTLLALMILRIVVRLAAGAPPYYPALARHERLLSSAVHGLLYLLLIVTPILGWLIISAFPALPSYFGLFQVPGLVPPDTDTVARPMYNAVLGPHEVLGWITGALATLHVGAALYHALYRGDGVFARMTGSRA